MKTISSFIVATLLLAVAYGQSGRIRPASDKQPDKNKSVNYNMRGSKPTSKTKSRQVLTLDQQARQQADEFWKSIVTQCGDSYIFVQRQWQSGELYQGKGISYNVDGHQTEHRPLSEIDRLNGVKQDPTEWSGTISIHFRVMRHGGRYADGTMSWSNWTEDRTIERNMVKENGQWKVENSQDHAGIFSKIGCDALSNSQ